MTPTMREQIHIALHAGLQSDAYPIVRNTPLGSIEGAFLGTLNDGSTEETAAYFNPPTYEFILAPTLDLVVASADPEIGITPEEITARDRMLDAAIQAVQAAFDAIDVWPDPVMNATMLPPEFTKHELFGAAGMKGASIAFEIEYWSHSQHG